MIILLVINIVAARVYVHPPTQSTRTLLRISAFNACWAIFSDWIQYKYDSIAWTSFSAPQQRTRSKKETRSSQDSRSRTLQLRWTQTITMKILFAVFFFFIGKSFVSQYNTQVENFVFPIITLVCLFGCSLFLQMASQRIFRSCTCTRAFSCILFRSLCGISLSRLLNSAQFNYFVSKRWLVGIENQETSFGT